MKVPLLELAHARSGDKGNTANVGVIAYDPEDYPILLEQLTVDRVAEHFGSLVKGKVERFELPRLHALNFLLHGALDGGGTVSLKTDAQGKVFSTAMLRMEVGVPPDVAKRVRGRGRHPGARNAGRGGHPSSAGDRRVQPKGGRAAESRIGQVGSVGMKGESPVLAEAVAGVAYLTLNRPWKRNALTSSMINELSGFLSRFGADPAVRVLALRGAGRDFCAGADLAEVAASRARGPELALAQAQALGDVFIKIRRLTKPVVAVVTGRALGGGCGLASACDLVIAHEEARFGYPEIHLGFVPAVVMAILKRKVRESAAFELLLGGHRIGAEEAASLGLVNQVFRAAAFPATVQEYLADLAGRPPTAVALTKRLLYGLDGTGFEDAIARGAEVNVVARHTEECRRGVDDFLGAKETDG